ncbi:hypothetical protein ETC03_22410 [Geobacillus sp. MMMUD3]|nr:hypothetical protein [Geobacillus sp. MMMUD3]
MSTPTQQPTTAADRPDENGTAASAPNPPSSTRTATARSPWNPANHEWVRGGTAVPYSAGPVFP